MRLIEQLTELSDDELLDLADTMRQELARRRQASRPRSVVEDIPASITRKVDLGGHDEVEGTAKGL
jgi:hypothetical protein